MGVNIEQVREALGKATGGEWHYDEMVYVWSGQQMLCQIRGWGHMTSTLGMSEDEATKQQDANAHLIANMCSTDGWGKQMADEIEALRAQNAELVEQRDSAHRRLRKTVQTVFVHNLLVDLGYETGYLNGDGTPVDLKEMMLGGNDGS